MRRAGVISGVNAPPPEEEPEQRETAKHVLLFLKDPERAANDKKRQSRREFSLFTVDLQRYKNVESMKGAHRPNGIGQAGAVFLANALRSGCCPRLRHLNLGCECR